MQHLIDYLRTQNIDATYSGATLTFAAEVEDIVDANGLLAGNRYALHVK